MAVSGTPAYSLQDQINALQANAPNDATPRLVAMEANGADYTVFKAAYATFKAGVDSFVAGVDARINGALDAIAAVNAKLLTAPLSIGEFAVSALPAASANADKFAYATDLFGAVRDKVAAVKIGATWYWVPTRTYTKTNVPIGSTTLAALSSPTTVIFNGTLLASATLTLSTANAYPGARIEIGFDGNISVGAITVSNLLGGATTTLGLNGRKTFYYADNNDGTFGWKAF